MSADDLLGGAAEGSESYDASAIEVLEGLEPVRKRPGMYVGGTDLRALHHLAAEVLDNAMDEAVAGHANRIEVSLAAGGELTIRDNGRGVPVDPHPKFPDRSALEVILCTLHAGGKFGGKAYQTSGGLHGVGVSVVNALSEHMRVEVARGRQLYAQEFSRGRPTGALAELGPAPNRRGTSVTFRPDPEIFGALAMSPGRLFTLARSKAYLHSGVEIRWHCAAPEGDIPAEAVFRFPGGLADHLAETLNGAETLTTQPFAGKVEFAGKFGVPGRVEWAVAFAPGREGGLSSYVNTVPTTEGGTHEAGLWAALLKGLRAYGERAGQKKAQQISREDVQAAASCLVSLFIREPEFVGQTKERLATADAARLVEQAVRDPFDHWLAADPKSAAAILDHLILVAEERQRRRAERETARKSATRRLRLPGKLVDCTRKAREGTELFIVEGDSAGGSAKMARSRETQALLPIRGKILNVLGAAASKLGQNAEIGDITQALGTGLGTKFRLADLRYERVIIMTDADVDGAHIAALLMTFFYAQMRPLMEAGHLYLACPPLYRLTQGTHRAYAADEAEKDALTARGLGGRGRIEVSRFKGLGEMDAKDLRETTMDPDTRRLVRVTLDEAAPGATRDLVERLMGKKAEARFAYIQENARFVEDLDV